MDPLRAAWAAAGSPGLPSTTRTRDGTCARCGHTGTTGRVSDALSRSFTSIDTWVNPDSPGLCAACSWAYRTSSLRTGPLLIRRDPPQLTHLTRSALRRQLSTPLAADAALCVPSTPGRKHVLPSSAWARINLDELHLTWTIEDTARLSATGRLRRAGATAAQLTQPIPPWTLLNGAAPTARERILQDWNELSPWRSAPGWIQLAAMAAAC